LLARKHILLIILKAEAFFISLSLYLGNFEATKEESRLICEAD
jgi:hypothetical protein